VVRAIWHPGVRRGGKAVQSHLQTQGIDSSITFGVYIWLCLAHDVVLWVYFIISPSGTLQGKPEYIKPENKGSSKGSNGSPTKKKKSSHTVVDGSSVVAETGMNENSSSLLADYW